MFGYVLPFKADLKVCQWTAYRAYYCGLCQELKREYGFVSRLLLNYDMVTLALLADGLAGTEPPVCAQRCVANPVEKRPWRRTAWCWPLITKLKTTWRTSVF